MGIQFHRSELQWLQSNLQGWSQMEWASMTTLEHGYIQDFLNQVRNCIINPGNTVNLPQEEAVFISKWLTDYKNNSGEYMFQGGPYGNNIQEGSQFPSLTGSANSNFEGEGAFGANEFQRSANIFNDILHKLGDIIYPPGSNTSSSPGGTP